jgi:tryptophan-rich sensory protein
LIEILVLWVAILGTIIAFWRVRPISGILLVPYLLWVTFAAVLNATLWRLNG